MIDFYIVVWSLALLAVVIYGTLEAVGELKLIRKQHERGAYNPDWRD